MPILISYKKMIITYRTRGIFIVRIPRVDPLLPSNVDPPLALGVVDICETIELYPGVWNNADDVTYQLYRGSEPIVGATGLTYEITREDMDYPLYWVVTGVNSNGSRSVTTNQLRADWWYVNAGNPWLVNGQPWWLGQGIYPCEFGEVSDVQEPQGVLDGDNDLILIIDFYVISEQGMAQGVMSADSDMSRVSQPIYIIGESGEVQSVMSADSDLIRGVLAILEQGMPQGVMGVDVDVSRVSQPLYIIIEQGEAQSVSSDDFWYRLDLTRLRDGQDEGGVSSSKSEESYLELLPDPPLNITAPVASGTLSPSQTLTVTDGTWSNSPTAYSYQWFLNGNPIALATSNSYVVQPGDELGTVNAEVVATNAGGSSLPAASNAIVAGFAPVYAFDPAVAIFLFDTGISEGLGDLMTSGWVSENGAYTLEAPTELGFLPPVRTAQGPLFSGTEYLRQDAFAPWFSGGVTVCAGMDNLSSSGSSTRYLWSAKTTDTSNSTQVDFVAMGSMSSSNSVRQVLRTRGSSSILIDRALGSLFVPKTSGVNLVCSLPAPGVVTFEGRDMDALTPKLLSGPQRAATITPRSYFTVGAFRRGALGETLVNSSNGPWVGSLRFFVIGSFNYDDAQINTLINALTAQGYM